MTDVDGIQFRDVPGFPGYRVGDDGSVWSCWHREGLGKSRGCRRVSIPGDWNRLKPRTDSRRRLHLKLCRGGRVFRFFVHQIVLEAFVGPCPPGMECCHFPDRDPSNCRLGNLRWDTKAANMADKAVHGTDSRGERNPRARLTAAKVRDIRARCESGESRPALAAEFGVALSTIDMAVERRTWSHV